MDFNETYIRLRERLFQFQEMRREMGPGADVPDEPLPAYEGPGGQNTPGLAATGSTAPTALGEAPPDHSDSPASRRAPNEPPPGYDEAQAQQLSNRLEDHMRDETERGTRDVEY
jgi:hypothetical protein